MTVCMLMAKVAWRASRGTHLVAVESFVVGSLLVSQLHPDHHFLLLRQILYIFFHAPQQNRAQLLLHTHSKCVIDSIVFVPLMVNQTDLSNVLSKLSIKTAEILVWPDHCKKAVSVM